MPPLEPMWAGWWLLHWYSYALAPTNPVSLDAGNCYAEAWIRVPQVDPVAGLTGLVVSL